MALNLENRIGATVSNNWSTTIQKTGFGLTEIVLAGNSPADLIIIQMPFEKAVELRAKLNAHILDNQRDSQA